MRKLTVLAFGTLLSTIASFAVTAPSMATGKDDYVCWMQPSGHTKCAPVAERYHVRDINFKPHKHQDKRKCNHCAVDFGLSHGNIDDLSHRVDTSTMRRFHDATLYGDKNRGIQE